MMKRTAIGWIVAALLAVGGGAFAYVFWFAGGSGEPSTDLTTPELSPTTTSVNSGTSTPGSVSTTANDSEQSFVIDQGQSMARFEIDEVLNGSPKHVVGTTDQVVGQVRIDPTDLATAQFSEIIINARTLTTDSERRDRAIRGPVILDSASDDNELIRYSVTTIEGLDGSVQSGETAEFTIIGELTVRGVTSEVTFDASVTLVDATTIRGTATAEITRDMFGIGIPRVPGVADVTNEVLIGIDFVAVAG